MDALVNTVTQYIDFLILGAVALLIWSIPFTVHNPITRAWAFLLAKCFPREREDRYSKFISVGLAGGLVFAIFYFSGYMLNSLGHYLLQDSHLAVIHESSLMYRLKDAPDKPAAEAALVPVRQLYLRTFGFGKPGAEEVESYRQDSIRQMHWQICDKASYEEAFSGTLLKQLRMSRGAVGILIILVFLSFVAMRLNGPKRRLLWPVGSILGAVVVFWLIVLLWRNAEIEAHGIGWAVYPPDPGMLALPCKPDFEYAVRNNRLVKQPSKEEESKKDK
jgi:hypothetical protein